MFVILGYEVADRRFRLLFDGSVGNWSVRYASDLEAECAAYDEILRHCEVPVLFSSGNITSGTIRIYGIRR